MGFLGPRKVDQCRERGMYSPVACRTLDKPEWLRNSEVKRAGAGQDETGQGGSWSTAGWVLQYLGEQTEKAPQERQTKASHSHLALSLAQSATDHNQGPDWIPN